MAREDADQIPRFGVPLPNAEHATIDPSKLREYALDPDNARGRHKAIVFERALGITLDDWEYLRDVLIERLPHCAVSGVRPPQHALGARTWRVVIPVDGLGSRAGRKLQALTGWKLERGTPYLVTAYVLPRSRQ